MNYSIYTDSELRFMMSDIRRELKKRKKSDSVTKIPYKPGGRVRNWNIYVLLLSGEKYYVGVTAQKVNQRFQQHLDGTGAKWTRQHKPLGIVESYSIGRMSESEAVKIETNKTMQVIAVHGTDRVRGGSLVRLDQAKMERTYQKLLKIHNASKAS